MKMWIRSVGLAVVHRIGMKITDAENGASLGRALFIPWGGKIHVIGLQQNVRLVFLPQKRLTYWKQEVGFTTHPPPDFLSLDAERVTPTRSPD